MTVTLEIKPEIENSLSMEAARKGLSLDAYLQGLIENVARERAASAVRLKEFSAALDELAAIGQPLTHLPSSALTREAISQDHD